MKTIRFAENLKRIREWREISKEELGERVGVSGVTVGYWETGRNEPRMGKVELIAGVLNVSIDDLLFSNDMNEIKANADKLMSEEKKKAIDMIANLSEEDVKLLNAIMERSMNKPE
ncbi:helix-turn-helix transcriptional regulator [Paenibacillus vini]|uniref:helix-turn-helix transcriptional regulator n=1 Tax=Paenibacillus vini TaxID=1476024 RepID=UPI0025B69384|nr:helix-turn-helix transcriptional regulator [Paenibacillus vini]MDN4069986.1 helix-turn-helix transcriptional regulator [Paenibacillus vini]